MKREILFRGLRTDGKGWVYGSITLPNTENEKTYIQDNEGVSKKVIPESVGQYIGLKDIHGVKIFEGDKVEWEDACGVDDDNGIVQFDLEKSCYIVFYDYHSYDSIEDVHYANIKIIGNIHEI